MILNQEYTIVHPVSLSNMAGLLTGEATEFNVAQVSSRSFVAMIYLTIFGSIIALTAYVWLLKTVQAARVATYTYVNPVIAVFLGWLILGEPLSTQMLAAAGIIFVAVILITTQRTKKDAAEKANDGPELSPEPSPQLAVATPKSEEVALTYAKPEKDGSFESPEGTSPVAGVSCCD